MRLLLVLVAFHPAADEVECLEGCLAALSPQIGYAVVVNNHRPGEPVERLAAGAQLFLTSRSNNGYGRAFNRALAALRDLPGEQPAWLGVLNTDLSWEPGTFERLLAWLEVQSQVVLAVPQITDPQGQPQRLCKRDPTLLALASRRFWPERLKPRWLRRYDAWYAMADQDYSQIFEVPYLSGCCMLARHDALRAVAGFDERYFLYLEDADLTRRLARLGQCVHLPVASVRHRWGRGSHRSLRLMFVTLQSAWLYFSRWGWRIMN
jgi:GT2 family glycosyltransferase